MLDQHVGERLDLVLGVGGAGRVRRRIEDEPLGLGCDGARQGRGLQLETVFELGLNDDRLGSRQQHDVGVAHPIGRGHDHFIARIEGGEQRIVEHLLAATADGDLRRLVGKPVLALEFLGDRPLKLGNAVHGGIFRLAAQNRLDRRLLDVVGRIEVRLAGAKADDVEARGLEFARLAGDGHGRRRLDPFERAGDQSHVDLLEDVKNADRSGRTLSGGAIARKASSVCSSKFAASFMPSCRAQAIIVPCAQPHLRHSYGREARGRATIRLKLRPNGVVDFASCRQTRAKSMTMRRQALRSSALLATSLLLSLILLFIFTLPSILVRAEPAFSGTSAAMGDADRVTPGDMNSGALLLQTEDGGLVEAPRLATDMVMTVNGTIARVTVTQRFENPSDRWLEGIYVFPLPERSAVDALHMEIGDRVIEGEIKGREEAKKAYEAAKDAGQKASLVEQERPNIFTNSVANIGPHEAIVVRIEYQEMVKQDAGIYSLRFPLVVAPRYNPKASEVTTVDFGGKPSVVD